MPKIPQQHGFFDITGVSRTEWNFPVHIAMIMLLSGLPFDYLVAALVTLLVVIDPLGLIPAFLAVTHGIPKKSRRDVALRAAFIAFCILAGAALIGDWLLRALSISLPAFRIAGGLLLFSIASEMVFGVRSERLSQTAERALEERVRSIAAFPLAIPLMAGPGAITAAVLLAGRTNGNVTQLALLLGVIGIVCAVSLAAFLAAHNIGKMIGDTANMVLSRLLGVLLAALAVQFVMDGVKAVWS